MPLSEEPTNDPSSDPTASLRWSYRDPSEPPLSADDPTQPFCARHAATVCRLIRAAFGPRSRRAGPPSRDWHFGTLEEIIDRRDWCRVCGLVADAVDTTLYADQSEVIACWVWDGVLKRPRDAEASDDVDVDEECTLRLRIAPELVGWEVSFEPFDLVPLDDAEASDASLFSGRRVAADSFDVELVRSWIRNCADWHGTKCVDTSPFQTSDWNVPFMRLISLSDDRLVEVTSPPPYAALSYVWGRAPVFKTETTNMAGLQQPGGLSNQQFPKSITDAMTLARSLDFRFLWVDSLCIIQDSPSDKAQQLRIMDGIYSRANLTIVAAAGADANAGIPGLKPGTRSLPQHTVRVSDGLTLVALRPDSHRAVSSTEWNTRGWTYQERLLSRRCLFSLPDGSVAFQCAVAVYGEDYRAETPRLVRCAPMLDISVNRTWMNPGSVRERRESSVRMARTPYLQEYYRLVEEYTARNMTFAGDRLLGIGGVLDVFRKAYGLRFLQGLPEMIFHAALLWQPRSRLKRIPINGDTGLPISPSWSWGGWTGPVGYEDWDDFNGVPMLEERWRRVVPMENLAINDGEKGDLRRIQCFSDSTGALPAGWSKVVATNDEICYTFGKDSERFHSVPLTASDPVAGTLRGSPPISVHIRTRMARFRLTNVNRTSDMNRSRPSVEAGGRFGLSVPSSDDGPWVGTILLPVRYRAKLGRDFEFIVLSEHYCFSNHEVASSVSRRIEPYSIYNVMMIRKVVGDELALYHARFAADAGESGECGWWSGKSVVERVGVGRILKSAWTGDEASEDFLLV